MFIEVSGEVFRIVAKAESGAWIISYENPCSPKFVSERDLNSYGRIEPPGEYMKLTEKAPTDGQQKRLALIAELMGEETYITDKQIRNQKMKELAGREHTTAKRIQRLYFKQWRVGHWWRNGRRRRNRRRIYRETSVGRLTPSIIPLRR